MEDNKAIAKAQGLFPALPAVDWVKIPVTSQVSTELEDSMADRLEFFKKDELFLEAARLPTSKATGPDCVPNEI